LARFSLEGITHRTVSQEEGGRRTED